MSDDLKAWKSFEANVAKLLFTAGYDVNHNVQIGHQQVDVYAIKKDLGRTIRTAVECKFESYPLKKEDVAHIYVKYDSLYDANKIDEILIVTINGMTAPAKEMVNCKRNLSHVTYIELQSSLMDFSRYLEYLIQLFNEDGLREYYIPLRYSKGDSNYSFDLFNYVKTWIDSHEVKPLALLSSYGTGKTSFSRFLAARLAENYNADVTSRIPILIDLGKISDEQSLEGLLGKVMTTEFFIRNYSFDLFMELNNQGRFLIIFDSFDEMKQGISWTSFLRNMDEIKRVITPLSRVIMCGRPSVFLDEAERLEALHDQYKVGQQWIRETTFKGFEEISLAKFDEKEIEMFLKKYLAYLKKTGTIKKDSIVRVFERLKDERAKGLLDLAKRPVQLKMIANVLPEWKDPLNELSRTLLYEHFIDLLIRRESKKTSRSHITCDDRRKFSRTLACHMWFSNGRHFIKADDIPKELVSSIPSAKLSNARAKLRELIVGSCLELKPPDLLYFPHRSVQEFLVAEEIVERFKNPNISLVELNDAMSADIADFVIGLIKPDDLISATSKILSHKGPLPLRIENMVQSSREFINHIVSQIKPGVSSVWPGLFYLSLYKKNHLDYRKLIEIGSYPYILIGMHLLFIECFPFMKDPESKKKYYSLNSIEKKFEYFTETLESIITMQTFRQHITKALDCLSEIVTAISIYNKKAKGYQLELGNVKNYFIQYYHSVGYFRHMFKGEIFSEEYDILTTLLISRKPLIERFIKFREKLLNAKF